MQKHAITGLYTYAEFGLCLLTFVPIMGVSSLIHRGDPTQRVPGQWMRRMGRTATRLSPLWKMEVEGERPEPESCQRAWRRKRSNQRSL